jgi:hypothetical protein
VIVRKFVQDWRPPQGLHIVDRASTSWKKLTEKKLCDEGMPNRPSIFAYLIFGLGGITVEGITRPMKISAWCGLGI